MHLIQLKKGVANQFANYTGCYARGKEYGLSKSGAVIIFDIRLRK